MGILTWSIELLSDLWKVVKEHLVTLEQYGLVQLLLLVPVGFLGCEGL